MLRIEKYYLKQLQKRPYYIVSDRKFNVNNCKKILILLFIFTSSVNLFISKSDRLLNTPNNTTLIS